MTLQDLLLLSLFKKQHKSIGATNCFFYLQPLHQKYHKIKNVETLCMCTVKQINLTE